MTMKDTADQIGRIASDIPGLVASGSIDSAFLLIAALRTHVDDLDGEALRHFHESGYSFSQLGDAIGVSRQTAHWRYRKLAS